MVKINKNNEPSGLKAYKKEMQLQGKKITYEDENAFTKYLTYQNQQNENAFLELRKALLKEQKFICCYCGQWIENVVNENGVPQMKTEHFYPKKAKIAKYGVLAEEWSNKQLDYENVLAACKGNENSLMGKHCDTQKDNTPLRYLMNPATSAYRPIFRYLVKPNTKEVVIKPLKNIGNVVAVEAEMKEVLNLNENSLKAKRFSAWRISIEKELGNEAAWNKKQVNTLYLEYVAYQKRDRLLPFHGFLVDYLAHWLSKY